MGSRSQSRKPSSLSVAAWSPCPALQSFLVTVQGEGGRAHACGHVLLTCWCVPKDKHRAPCWLCRKEQRGRVPVSPGWAVPAVAGRCPGPWAEWLQAAGSTPHSSPQPIPPAARPSCCHGWPASLSCLPWCECVALLQKDGVGRQAAWPGGKVRLRIGAELQSNRSCSVALVEFHILFELQFPIYYSNDEGTPMVVEYRTCHRAVARQIVLRWSKL